MNGGALHHPLKASSRLGIAAAFRHQAGQILVEKFGQVALEFINVNTAGAQHARGISVIAQGQQQVFKGGVFMPALASQAQGAMQRLF
jgi:hypothetical protein